MWIYRQKQGEIMKRTLLLAAFLPLAAHAADWRYLSNDDDWSSIYYAEIAGAVSAGPLVTMWLQRVNKDPDKAKVKSEKLRYQFNCKAQQLRLIQFVEYSANGDVLNSDTYTNASWKDTVPDTLGEHWLKFVCGGQKRWKSGLAVQSPSDASEYYWNSQAKEAATADVPPSNSDAPTPCRFDENGVAICDQ